MPGRMWLEDDPGHIAEKVMWLHVIGRLKPGVDRKQVQANVDIVFKQVVAEEFSQLSRSQPDILKQSLKLHDAANGVSSLRGDFADPLYVLMAVVGRDRRPRATATPLRPPALRFPSYVNGRPFRRSPGCR